MQQLIRQKVRQVGRYVIGKTGPSLVLLAMVLGVMAGFQSMQAHAAPLHSQTATGGSYADTIRQVFGPYGNQAVRIAECESSMNPNAYNGILGAAGLFQIIPSTWASTSEAGQSVYNPYANIRAAHEIFVRDGNSFAEWQCKG